MAAIGGRRTLPLLRGVLEHPIADAERVSLRGLADLAMGSEAAQSESQGYLGAHDAPGKALAATGTYLSPLCIAEHGRYHSRQEPGAVVRHAGIRGGGARKGHPYADNLSPRRRRSASGIDPPGRPREDLKQRKLQEAEYRCGAQGRTA